MSDERPPLSLKPMLQVLDSHGVHHVVIGGVAATAHGSSKSTRDLDFTPDPARENLDRLAAALKEMNARVRAPEAEPVEMDFDGHTILQFTTFATRTDYGDIDVVMRPDGIPGGYKQLVDGALTEAAYGVDVTYASLEDLIASRRAAAELTGNRHYDDVVHDLELLRPGSPESALEQDEGLDLEL